jgi:RNA polymerase sigma factor (sigma-70 family)
MARPALNDAEARDRLLAVRCQLGDASAWRELVTLWQPRLWRHALGMLRRRAAAEDALQAIWLQVVRGFGGLREPERLAAWLHGVARQVIQERIRASYTAAEQTESLAAEPLARETDAALHLELREEVLVALESLPPIEREAIVLHYLDELSVDAVAAVCGVPVGTIKSRLHRGRARLRAQLETLERTS